MNSNEMEVRSNKTGMGIKKEEVERKEIMRGEGENKAEAKKKRGRRRKDEPVELVNPKDQNKFFVDVSKDQENKELILNFLSQANNKDQGREITFKDLVFISLPKITPKDIEKLQESCLSEMEKVERALSEYNKKNEVNLTLGEFLVRKLGIN